MKIEDSMLLKGIVWTFYVASTFFPFLKKKPNEMERRPVDMNSSLNVRIIRPPQ